MIRAMQLPDVDAVAELLPELGYQATGLDLTKRLLALLEWPDQVAFVLEDEGRVVGLCQVQGVRLLASEGYAEVQAIVVARAFQRRGFGRALLQHARAWAKSRAYRRLRLRSGTHRSEAHAFYLSQGFAQSRASYAFEDLVNDCGDRAGGD